MHSDSNVLKGCPRQGCNCRRMIDLYLVPIGTFKAMYMAVEEVCITQLAFVRAKNPVWPPAEGGKSLSRAVEAGLYLTPNSKSWPPCLVKHISNPDPPRGGASSNPLHLDAKQGRQATRSSAGMAPPPAPQRARSSNQLTPNPGPISPADEDDSSKTSESTAINDSSAPETVKSKVELVGDAKGHPSEVPSRANLDLLEKIFGGASDHPELDSSRQQLPASATDTKEVVQARPRDINLASLDSSKKFITTGPKMTDNDDTPLDKPPPSIKSNKRQILTARKTTGIIRPTGRFTQNGVGVLVPRRRRLSTAGGEPSLSQGKPGMEQDRSDSIQSESPTKASFGTAQLPIELTDPEKSSPHIPGDSTTAADKMQADASGSHLEGRDNTPVSSASSIHEQNIRAPRESELIGARKRLHVQLQESDRMVETQVSRSSPGPLSPSLEGISLITTHLTKRAKITEHLTSKDVHQVLLTPSTKHFVDQSGTSESKAIGSEKDVAIPQVVKTMEDETIAAANAMSSTLKILSHLAGKSLSDRGETGDEDTSTTSSRSKSSRISKTSPGKRKKPSLGVRSTSDTSTHSRANSARFLTPTSPASLTKSQIQSGDPPSGPSTSVSPAPLLPHEPYPESSGGTQNHSPPVTILEDQSIIQIMTGINSEETISFSSSDEALQLLLPTQEARRLLCILVGFGIPLEWDMVSISREGITVRDEVSPNFDAIRTFSLKINRKNRELVTSYMNEECVRLLSGRGIRISIGPREMLSPDDVREISNATVCRMDDSVTRLGDVDARISIVDTRCERWRRHPLWEVSRLQNIIRTILKVELPPNEDINKIDLGVQISDQYRATTLLLPPVNNIKTPH
ncbi:hypothetical protein FRC16_000891 [Serendipita sp. 398]|nr:hypothetical protein FRC16_000891 [Serendipita sp. 398]